MLLGRWLVECSLLSLVSVPGTPLVVIGGILWLVVLLLPLRSLPVGWSLTGGLYLIWQPGRTLTVVGGPVRSFCLFSALLCGLLLGRLLWIVRGSKSAEFLRAWENYDDWLRFLARPDATLLDESLLVGDVSRAWMVWSGAAEAALADAY